MTADVVVTGASVVIVAGGPVVVVDWGVSALEVVVAPAFGSPPPPLQLAATTHSVATNATSRRRDMTRR